MKQELHSTLYVFALQNPQAETRLNGKQLFWKDGTRENSVTFFEDSELDEAKKMARFMNDVSFAGNLRFSSTN